MANVPNVPNVPNVSGAGINDTTGPANFEFTRMQLCGSLSAVAGAMRDAAIYADQFSQLLRDIPYHPGHPGFLPGPNGQYLQLPPAPPPPAHTGGKRKNAEEAEDGKKKRKTKKDPDAPKRPASSYLLFQNDVRQELKAKNPHLPNNELLNMISKAWGEMPREQKDAYEERQRVAKGHYLAEKAAYENRNAAPAADVSPPPQVRQDTGVKPTAVSQAAPPQVPVTSTSEEDESPESSEDSDSDDSEEEAPPPSTKKSKHQTANLVKTEKEKKHKKSKA